MVTLHVSVARCNNVVAIVKQFYMICVSERLPCPRRCYLNKDCLTC